MPCQCPHPGGKTHQGAPGSPLLLSVATTAGILLRVETQVHLFKLQRAEILRSEQGREARPEKPPGGCSCYGLLWHRPYRGHCAEAAS